MKREGKVCVCVYHSRYEKLSDQAKRQYNAVTYTNHTVKQPFYCPTGKSQCKLCSDYENSGRYKRKLLKHEMVNKIKYIDY